MWWLVDWSAVWHFSTVKIYTICHSFSFIFRLLDWNFVWWQLLYYLLYYLHLFLMFLVVISLIFHSLLSVGIIATYHIHLQQWGSTASLPFLSTFYFYTCWKPSLMLFLLSHYCSSWLNLNVVCCLPSVRPNPDSSISLFRCRFLSDIVLLVPEDPSILFIYSPSSTRLIINSITLLETVLVSPYFWKGLLMDIEFSALRDAARCDFP